MDVGLSLGQSRDGANLSYVTVQFACSDMRGREGGTTEPWVGLVKELKVLTVQHEFWFEKKLLQKSTAKQKGGELMPINGAGLSTLHNMTKTGGGEGGTFLFCISYLLGHMHDVSSEGRGFVLVRANFDEPTALSHVAKWDSKTFQLACSSQRCSYLVNENESFLGNISKIASYSNVLTGTDSSFRL